MNHEYYMHRCIELARNGAGSVAPNPMVGAVLVHGERIIGEGYHEKYGHVHAEVNCIGHVAPADRSLIPLSTLYVSLEPCAHHGKTPPCSDLIIRNNIQKVVVGCRDPFSLVDGKGIEKLKQAGVEVTVDVLKEACMRLNKRFFTFVRQRRPYIILKWAQTSDGKIGRATGERLLITNDATNRLVHRWRAEEAAILVGTDTALNDDPALTNRWWKGKDPVRLVIDRTLRLPSHLRVFDGSQQTIVFNEIRETEEHHLQHHLITGSSPLVQQVVDAAYRYGLQSILVEGGAKTLQSFIDACLWDEARVITNSAMSVSDGIAAPVLHQNVLMKEEMIRTDRIAYHILASSSNRTQEF